MLAEQMNSQTLNMNFILIRKQMSVGIRLHEKCFMSLLCKWCLDKSFKHLLVSGQLTITELSSGPLVPRVTP